MNETLFDCYIGIDCWKRVCDYIYDYETYKSLINTCKFFRYINTYELNMKMCIRGIVAISLDSDHKLNSHYKKINASYTKEFDIDFIAKHLKYKWNWRYLSENINTIYIDKYIYLPWNWMYIAKNLKITESFVSNHLEEFSSVWHYLAGNSQLSTKFILDNYINNKNIYESLSSNRSLDLDYVLNHLDKKWDYLRILLNHGKKFEFVLKIIQKLKTNDWYYVSYYLEDFNNVIKYPDFEWDFQGLSRNEKITLNDFLNISELFLKLNKSMHWEWDRLSKFVKIRKSLLIDNPKINEYLKNNENAYEHLIIENEPIIENKIPRYYRKVSRLTYYGYQKRVFIYEDTDYYNLNYEYIMNLNLNIVYIDIDYIKYLFKNLSSGKFNAVIRKLISSKFITLIDIVDHPEIPWIYDKFYFEEKIYY